MTTIVPPSLRDYYAATAPTEIPDWFKPSMDHLGHPAPPVASDPPQVWKAWNDGSEQRLAEKAQCRFFAWRWHYADQMVKTDPNSKVRSL